jgi:uncharacterized DUF497 family protein
MDALQFDWDQWNIQKNEDKHGISVLEAQSTFYDKNLIIFDDIKHSTNERRYICFGHSTYNNILMLAFTIRNKKVRIISARKASKKERTIYETKA